MDEAAEFDSPLPTRWRRPRGAGAELAERGGDATAGGSAAAAGPRGSLSESGGDSLPSLPVACTSELLAPRACGGFFAALAARGRTPMSSLRSPTTAGGAFKSVRMPEVLLPPPSSTASGKLPGGCSACGEGRTSAGCTPAAEGATFQAVSWRSGDLTSVVGWIAPSGLPEQPAHHASEAANVATTMRRFMGRSSSIPRQDVLAAAN